MLLTIIVVFLICWGPKLILNILKRHELDMLHHDKAFETSVSVLPMEDSLDFSKIFSSSFI